MLFALMVLPSVQADSADPIGKVIQMISDLLGPVRVDFTLLPCTVFFQPVLPGGAHFCMDTTTYRVFSPAYRIFSFVPACLVFLLPLYALAFTLIGGACMLSGHYNRRGRGGKIMTAGVAAFHFLCIMQLGPNRAT